MRRTVTVSYAQVRLVERLAVCAAPKILSAGIEAVGDLGVRDLSDPLFLNDTTTCGVDLILDSRVEYPAGRNGTGSE